MLSVDKVADVPLRAEFPSLKDYLANRLTADERRSIGLLSFNQWAFTTRALVETAITAHDLGSRVSVGFWADATPLPDPGWTTSRSFARLLRSRSIDQNAELALVSSGLMPASIVDPPIRRWSPSQAIDLPSPLTRSAIRAMTYHGSGMGRSILQVHPDFNTPIRDDYVWPDAWIARAARSYGWVYDQTRALIRARAMRTLIVYNGRFTHDQAAAAAAQAEGVRVLYYDAGGLETDFDLTFAATHDWADLQRRMLRMWEAWDDDDRDQIATSWFTNRQQHNEPGLDVFVGHQTRGHLGDTPEAEQLVVFFSSSGDEIYELDIDWNEYLHSQERALLDLAAACRERPGTRLVVRTHPHMRLKPDDDMTEWLGAVEEANPHTHFDASSPVDSYELMRAADVVFTYGSTAGIESAFIGKPVVVMGPSAYDLLGCAKRITSAAEIPEALASPPPADPEKALPYGLMMQRRGFNYEHIQTESSESPSAGGVPLHEASETARKLSDARLRFLKRRLTR
jgi:hypothetical protein